MHPVAISANDNRLQFNGFYYGDFRRLSVQQNPMLASVLLEQMTSVRQLLNALRCCQLFRHILLTRPDLRQRLCATLQAFCDKQISKVSKHVYSVPDNPHARCIALSRSKRQSDVKWLSSTILPLRNAERLLEVRLQFFPTMLPADRHCTLEVFTVCQPISFDGRGLIETHSLIDQLCGSQESALNVALDCDVQRHKAIVIKIAACSPFAAQATLEWPQ